MLIISRLDGRGIPRHVGVTLIHGAEIRRVPLSSARHGSRDHHPDRGDKSVRIQVPSEQPTTQNVPVAIDEPLSKPEYCNFDHIFEVIEGVARREVRRQSDVYRFFGYQIGVGVSTSNHVFCTIADDEQGLLIGIGAKEIRALCNTSVRVETPVQPSRTIRVVVSFGVDAIDTGYAQVRRKLDTLQGFVHVRGPGVHIGVESTLV